MPDGQSQISSTPWNGEPHQACMARNPGEHSPSTTVKLSPTSTTAASCAQRSCTGSTSGVPPPAKSCSAAPSAQQPPATRHAQQHEPQPNATPSRQHSAHNCAPQPPEVRRSHEPPWQLHAEPGHVPSLLPTWARKKPSRSAAFFAHMWTTVPSEPRAHRRQVSFLSSLALCDRRPCTRSKSSGFFTADFPMVQDFSIRLTFPVDWVFSALTTGIPRGWVALVMVRPRCKDSFQDGLTVSEFLAGSGSRTLGQFPKKNVYPA